MLFAAFLDYDLSCISEPKSQIWVAKIVHLHENCNIFPGFSTMVFIWMVFIDFLIVFSDLSMVSKVPQGVLLGFLRVEGFIQGFIAGFFRVSFRVSFTVSLGFHLGSLCGFIQGFFRIQFVVSLGFHLGFISVSRVSFRLSFGCLFFPSFGISFRVHLAFLQRFFRFFFRVRVFVGVCFLVTFMH